ncbi:MAG: UDP-2,3-diacylglucosamine diphosphatase [Polyangiaceae bacterium]
MKIAVISDLHLGSGGPADAFGHDDAEFGKFLRFLETNFERIVLLGDVWETLTGRDYGNPGAELDRARSHHREIAGRLALPKYRYLHGNHDLVAGTRGVRDEWVAEADGVRLLFTHGHQNDLIVKHARFVSEFGVWLGGWIRRLGLAPVYALFRHLDGMRGGASTDALRCTFQRWAVHEARRRDVDVVVTGHTHIAARAEHGDRLFLNSGSCAGGNYSFLSLDTRLGEYRVCHGW